MPLQHRKNHDEKKDLLRMQNIKSLLDLAGRIFDKHQESPESKPSHENKSKNQPIVCP